MKLPSSLPSPREKKSFVSTSSLLGKEIEDKVRSRLGEKVEQANPC
jgi:hypothetical protein